MKECAHPPERQLYMQLNADPSLRITIADLCGGINPYVWRVEYCGICLTIRHAFGDVPQTVLDDHRKTHERWLNRPI